jgi:hypothetical protein
VPAGRKAHVLLVYSDREELKSQLRGYLARAARSGHRLTILSDDPSRDRRMVPPQETKLLHLHDARAIAGGRAEFVRSFRSILREEWAEAKSESNPSGWTWIGTWPQLRYGDFDTVLDCERIFSANAPSVGLCAYRNEGFCSLPPRQIAAVLDLHDEFVFPRTSPEPN